MEFESIQQTTNKQKKQKSVVFVRRYCEYNYIIYIQSSKW